MGNVIKIKHIAAQAAFIICAVAGVPYIFENCIGIGQKIFLYQFIMQFYVNTALGKERDIVRTLVNRYIRKLVFKNFGGFFQVVFVDENVYVTARAKPAFRIILL